MNVDNDLRLAQTPHTPINRARTPAEKKVYERRRNWARQGANPPTRPEPTVCECCGKSPAKTLHLDHDHKTGAFRGWLCRPCNQAIGMLGDNVTGLLKALSYLTTGK